MLALGRVMHKESPQYQRYDFNERKASFGLERFVEHPNFFVAVDGTPVHAMLIGGVNNVWWADERAADDILFYVHPDYRGGSSARRLLAAYVKWARNAGVRDDAIRVTLSTGVEPEKTSKFLKRVGFKPSTFGFAFGG